jgi:hypothetical protein
MSQHVLQKIKQTRIFKIKSYMNTKLTLTIEKEIIDIAKKYAKDKGQSLSELVENYFKLITVNRREIKPKQLSPRIRRLRGIIKTNEKLNHKQIITEELSKKYGI